MAGCSAYALAYLHSQSIIRPDVKRGNLLIQREPMAATLRDFGAARTLLPRAPDGCNEGLNLERCTVRCAAPEVLMSSNAYGTPSDMWSMGITIAQMENWDRAILEQVEHRHDV